MAYLKPQPLLAKIINPLSMKLSSRVATLVVPRRESGTPQKVPLVVVELEGKRYLVSARGDTDWVKNLRKAERGELIEGKTSCFVSTSEVPTERRAPIIASYRAKTGRTLAPLFRKLPEDKDHPVFELT